MPGDDWWWSERKMIRRVPSLYYFDYLWHNASTVYHVGVGG